MLEQEISRLLEQKKTKNLDVPNMIKSNARHHVGSSGFIHMGLEVFMKRSQSLVCDINVIKQNKRPALGAEDSIQVNFMMMLK